MPEAFDVRTRMSEEEAFPVYILLCEGSDGPARCVGKGQVPVVGLTAFVPYLRRQGVVISYLWQGKSEIFVREMNVI